MAEGKIVDIAALDPHKASEVICVHCGKRWLAVRPTETLLRDLRCPDCKNYGYVIETGEVLKEECD